MNMKFITNGLAKAGTVIKKTAAKSKIFTILFNIYLSNSFSKKKSHLKCTNLDRFFIFIA